jgi:predicted nucleotidyltransferase
MKELTKNRADLLRLFFTNPEQSFYIQEMGKILGKKPGVFQRTLNNMEKEGILKSEFKANAKFFKANKDYPLFKELKSIVFKTVGVTGSLKEALEKIGRIHCSFIYGSYAKAKENYLSDIDLVVIGEPDEDALIGKLDKLEGILKREINYKLYSLKQFKSNLKEKEPFLLEILRNKKVMIIEEENELRKILKGRSDQETKS